MKQCQRLLSARETVSESSPGSSHSRYRCNECVGVSGRPVVFEFVRTKVAVPDRISAATSTCLVRKLLSFGGRPNRACRPLTALVVFAAGLKMVFMDFDSQAGAAQCVGYVVRAEAPVHEERDRIKLLHPAGVTRIGSLLRRRVFRSHNLRPDGQSIRPPNIAPQSRRLRYGHWPKPAVQTRHADR